MKSSIATSAPSRREAFEAAARYDVRGEQPAVVVLAPRCSLGRGRCLCDGWRVLRGRRRRTPQHEGRVVQVGEGLE